MTIITTLPARITALAIQGFMNSPGDCILEISDFAVNERAAWFNPTFQKSHETHDVPEFQKAIGHIVQPPQVLVEMGDTSAFGLDVPEFALHTPMANCVAQ